MPSAADGPTVALSFANNFWGKEDAGVGPLLDRMASAKQTSDELRSFYSARASIEDDYARKLTSLCRKALGSHEMGSLKASLDTVRGEVEAMAKQHANIAQQMKSELEEPLAAFAGGMKERRKIIQNTVEKLLKVKIQQTQVVNKTRDRYEQDCLRIKGYLAQGHMVMGQEERKNKAKLEKTQISLASSNAEYEAAVKALEDTTARWNREWKAAADKFQDLEEERLDFTKGSLWTLANIASTVCVSDDASCEKIRLSLEKMDVEKDIVHFITEKGTGQEIPDPPKYINFCRGDMDDHRSEVSDDDNYSVAQFPRSINPAFRTSSPQPSTFESHHDPNSALARDLGHGGPKMPQQVMPPRGSLDFDHSPLVLSQDRRENSYSQVAPPLARREDSYSQNHPPLDRRNDSFSQPQQTDSGQFAAVPHDPYPMDGMTMLCRTDGGMNSATNSNVSSRFDATSSNLSARPSSRDDNSDYSNPTSFSSQDPPSANVAPPKPEPVVAQPATVEPEKRLFKKKSGFFQNHSPFRRKSTKDVQQPSTNTNRNTWAPTSTQSSSSTPRRPQVYASDSQQNMITDRTASPEPIEANATLALNVGQNVFPVANTDKRKTVDNNARPAQEEQDPIARALAELKGVGGGTKLSASRISADRYHGISTPVPDRTQDQPQSFNRSTPTARPKSEAAGTPRAAPPPSYDTPVQRLGVPSPAVTSKAMKESTRKYTESKRDIFTASRPASVYNSTPTRPATRSSDVPRAVSPVAPRSTSPRPGMHPDTRQTHRSASPNPYSGSQHRASPQTQTNMPPNRGSGQGFYRQDSRQNSPATANSRTASPAPYRGDYDRPSSSRGSAMAVQLAPVGGDGSVYGGSMRGRGGGGSRPGTSSSSRAMSFYDGRDPNAQENRQRSKSVADPSRQYTPEGRAILHYARALYMYQAAIPEELGFAKGDTLAVLRHQDDGWWEAEIHAGQGVGRAFEWIRTPYRAAVSPAAKRTYLGTILFVSAALALTCIAALAYPIFYYSYVPKKVITIPTHLQYNAALNPYAVTHLSPNLMLEQAYDVSVELTLPRSSANLERGNFMVALHALKTKADNPALAFTYPSDPHEHLTTENVVFSSRRPVLIPYQDPLVSMASRVFFILYHLVFSHSSQTDKLIIPMGELVEFRGALPLSIILDIEAGQTLQVYTSTITLVARLTGLRWFMYNHRILSFIVCTSVFWLAEVLSMGMAWIILSFCFSGRKNKTVIKKEKSIEAPSRWDPEPERFKTEEDVNIKQEDTEQDTLIGSPRHAGDADDEDDEEDALGSGTGLERKAGGLRRRVSGGRA
ncbi:hypothetical protein GGR57DRAFT_491731 [Xylariaceae sp. FL1272]|nr:hypothetical protein GGR57DRAFT_491731 [Xylariaceae sp. FL1272]